MFNTTRMAPDSGARAQRQHMFPTSTLNVGRAPSDARLPATRIVSASAEHGARSLPLRLNSASASNTRVRGDDSAKPSGANAAARSVVFSRTGNSRARAYWAEALVGAEPSDVYRIAPNDTCCETV